MRAIGTSTFHARLSVFGPGGRKVTINAAALVRRAWIVKDAQRTQRRLGETSRWKRANRKEPRQKDAIDRADLYRRGPGVDVAKLASPRPTYTVFPDSY
jgi:hypothetical protein